MKKGWRTTTLGEVCEFRRGLTYKKTDEVAHSSNAVLRANNIDATTGRLVFDEIRYINDKINIPSSKMIEPGALLVCTASGSKSHLGKVALIDTDQPYAFGGFMGLLVPGDSIDSKYLFWVTRSEKYRDYLMQLSDGVNINNLKWKQLAEFSFPLPPLPEQKRIVAILDEAFAAIDKATANAEKNRKNAEAILGTELSRVFESEAQKWRKTRLSDVCTLRNGRAYKRSELLSSGKYRVLRVGNFFTSDKWYYSDLELEDSKYCDSGDLLYAWSASFGPRIWQGGKVIYHYHIWRVDVDDSLVTKGFLYYWLGWDADRIKSEHGAGTTMIHVSKKSMDQRILHVPPISEQVRIVDRLNRLFDQQSCLAALINEKFALLEALKESLLHQAFAGRLTDRAADRQLAEAGA